MRREALPKRLWRTVDPDTGEVSYGDKPEWIGGDRGQVLGWTSQSRRRFLKYMASLDLRAVTDELGGRFMMVTLTYRDDPGPVEAKRHLDNLQRKLRRYMGGLYDRELLAVWKMEFQRRGAVHFHFLMWLPDAGPLALYDFQRDLEQMWFVVTGGFSCSNDPHHRRYSAAKCHAGRHASRTQAHWCEARDVARYIAADQVRDSKAYQYRLPDSWKDGGGGRWWGHWGIDPSWQEQHLSYGEFVQVRRLLRRHRKANALRRVREGRSGTPRIVWVIGDDVGSLHGVADRWLQLARSSPARSKQGLTVLE